MLPFKLVYHDAFNVDLGPHVFPSRKYRAVRDALLAQGLAGPDDFTTPKPATDDEVGLAHTPEHVRKARTGDFTVTEQRTLEVPWSPALATACWHSTGACIAAGRLARRDGCAIVLGGGLHHAFADHGEGFCLINDIAIAVRVLRRQGEARRVAILDLDVHQGNGTATILGGEPDSFCVSLHQEANYPMPKASSHLDVGLRDGTGDAAYLSALTGPLKRILDWKPDLLFYLAGADPYAHDRLGGLALSKEGLRERDLRVFAAARSAGLPVAATLAGGYAERPEDTVLIHVATVCAAAAAFGSGPARQGPSS